MSHTLSDDELLRYSRQILLNNWDIDAQLRLKNSRVLIIGAGGLGCPVAETLARAGVGHLKLIDDDVIEVSNLQRQTLFGDADIGNSKAATACRVLHNINPLIHVSHVECRLSDDLLLPNADKQLLSVAGQMPDLLLDCTDNFATRDLINRISVTEGIALLSASAIAMTGQLALFEPAQGTGCYHCLFPNVADRADSRGDEGNCTNSGVLASTTTVMGNLQANAALQYLGLQHNPLSGKLLLWDGRYMTQKLLNYTADRQCHVCAKI